MRTMVTGGAGFIGSNLVQALAEQGAQTVVLDDFSSSYRENLAGAGSGVEVVEGSVLDADRVASLARDADVVFHLAPSVGNKRSIDDPIFDATTNVMGTLNVLQACRAGGVAKIVFSSSAGIFGELKQLPIDESHPVEPDSPYGGSKLAAEKECLAFAKLFELDAIALRYFNVYGPNQRFDQYGNVIPIFVFRMLRGEPVTVFGDGQQTRDFINVRDVVQANLKAAEAHGVSGAFNLGSGMRISINDLVRELATSMPREPVVEYGPPRPGDVRDSLADISRAKATLGFSPSVDLTEGLRDYVRWAKGEDAASRGS